MKWLFGGFDYSQQLPCSRAVIPAKAGIYSCIRDPFLILIFHFVFWYFIYNFSGETDAWKAKIFIHAGDSKSFS